MTNFDDTSYHSKCAGHRESKRDNVGHIADSFEEIDQRDDRPRISDIRNNIETPEGFTHGQIEARKREAEE